MNEIEAQRTLVKSPPEVWAQLSDAESLARHLEEFGEVRITRREPERIVAWEGQKARGTVQIETSGWGTKVTLTAIPAVEQAPEPEPPPAPWPRPDWRPFVPQVPLGEIRAETAAPPDCPPSSEPQSDPEPDPRPRPEPDEFTLDLPDPPAPPRWGLFGRLFGLRFEAPPAPQPVPPPATPDEPGPEPGPEPEQPEPIPPGPEPVPTPGPEPVPDPPDEPLPRPGDPLPPAAADAPPVRPAIDPETARSILNAVLDDLNAAHHRPFSRA